MDRYTTCLQFVTLYSSTIEISETEFLDIVVTHNGKKKLQMPVMDRPFLLHP